MNCGQANEALLLTPLNVRGDALAPEEASAFALHVAACTRCGAVFGCASST